MNKNLSFRKCLNEMSRTAGQPVFNLRRHGFVLAPEENFSDDGTYFRGYYYDPEKKGDKRFRASKASVDGDIYLSVRYEDPITNKTTYFDDLNGVTTDAANKGIEDLVKKIEDFKRKLDAGEIKAHELSDEEKEDLIEITVKAYMDGATSSFYAVDDIAKKRGFDFRDLKKEDQKYIRNEIKKRIADRKTDDPKLVKEFASLFLKEVMKEMTDRSYSGRKGWVSIPAKDLENAIEEASTSIEKLSDGEWYQLKDFSTTTQEKIRTWAKNRLEKLYDFDESLKPNEKYSNDYMYDVDQIVHDAIKYYNEGWVEEIPTLDSIIDTMLENGYTKEEIEKYKPNIKKFFEDKMKDAGLNESYNTEVECLHSDYDDNFGKKENYYDVGKAHEFMNLDDTVPKIKEYSEEEIEVDYDDEF